LVSDWRDAPPSPPAQSIPDRAAALCNAYRYSYGGQFYDACWRDTVQSLERENAAAYAPPPVQQQTDTLAPAIFTGIGIAAQSRANTDAAMIRNLQQQQQQQPAMQHTSCTRVPATPATPSGLNCTTTNF
jgi:hypothetical protein